MAKLTKRDVDAFSFAGTGNSSLLWDGELKGFGVRAFPSGTKNSSFSIEPAAGNSAA
jgi:hypothetical protein